MDLPSQISITFGLHLSSLSFLIQSLIFNTDGLGVGGALAQILILSPPPRNPSTSHLITLISWWKHLHPHASEKEEEGGDPPKQLL